MADSALFLTEYLIIFWKKSLAKIKENYQSIWQKCYLTVIW